MEVVILNRSRLAEHCLEMAYQGQTVRMEGSLARLIQQRTREVRGAKGVACKDKETVKRDFYLKTRIGHKRTGPPNRSQGDAAKYPSQTGYYNWQRNLLSIYL